MGDTRNYWRGVRWKELVTLVMRSEGLDVTMRPTARTGTRGILSEALNESVPMSDIIGLPDVAVITRNETKQDWSAALDSAQFAATADNLAYGVAIQFRAGREVEQSYVCMTLKDFVGLLREREQVTA